MTIGRLYSKVVTKPFLLVITREMHIILFGRSCRFCFSFFCVENVQRETEIWLFGCEKNFRHIFVLFIIQSRGTSF